MKRKYREAMREKAGRQREEAGAVLDMAADTLKWFDEQRARQATQQKSQVNSNQRSKE